MEDRLNTRLLNMGFRRMDSNSQGIYLFYRAAENGLTIVSVIHAINGNEITVEQYSHILEQIKRNFMNSYSGNLHLLSLIVTRFPDKVKHFCSSVSQDDHWIIDPSTNRLMLYESQSYGFDELRTMIEQLLEEEPNSPNHRSYNRGTRRALPFTLMNVSVIIINIIAYFIMHFTSVLGGEDQMLSRGALSWYYVVKDNEYYRIFTSMFMHNDWSHLFNNMLVLLFVGVNLERVAGKAKYLMIYFGTGIIAGLTSIGYNMWKEGAVLSASDTTFSIGASGAIFGVVGAILYMVIINKGRLAEFSTTQMILFIGLSLYSGIVNTHIDQAAHIGGFLGGLLLAAILYRRPGSRKLSGMDHS